MRGELGDTFGRKLKGMASMKIHAAVLAVLAAAAVAGCGATAQAASPAPFTLTGDLQVQCRGTFEDITDGATVTVYDAAGTVVAVGHLGKEGDPAMQGRCMWPITVPNVPATSAFYGVEVTHRGKVTVPATQAQAGDVHLTLGNIHDY